MSNRISVVSWVLFITGFSLVAVGMVVNEMWTNITWAPTILLSELGFVSLVLAVVVRGIFRCHLATCAAIVWLIGLIFYASVPALLSVLLIAVAAIAIGSYFVAKEVDARLAVSTLGGLAILCGLTGWLLPFPIHGHLVYLSALLLIIAFRRRSVIDLLRPVALSWTQAVADAPRMALLAVLTLGVISTCAWPPTIHYDDLAYHLGLPYQLQTFGYYRMDAGSRVWAISAWAGDVLQGIAQVVAEHESRGAVDTFWLVLTAVLMWNLGKALDLKSGIRWLAVALYASAPITADTLTGMQTEGATAAVAVGIALLIQRASLPSGRLAVLLGLLFGLLLELKISNLMIAGPLGLWLLWQWRRYLSWRFLSAIAATALVAAGSSYFYSYLLVHNPVLPLFNLFFHSSYYLESNFHDPHWNSGFHWDILWQIVFHSRNYIEGGYSDGVAGFVLIALSGSLLVALHNHRARLLALVAAAAFFLPLTQIQYLRYAEPAMALLVPVMLSGLPINDLGKLRVRSVQVILVILVMVNMAYLANANWQMRGGLLRKLLVHGSASITEIYAPTRVVAQFIRLAYGERARTLILDDRSPFAAELAGNAFVTNWYDLELATLSSGADEDVSGGKWVNVFDHSGANLISIASDQHTPAMDAAIETAGAVRVFVENNVELWELHRGKPGTALPINPDGVSINFDTSASPANSTIVHANLKFSCVAKGVPIVVSWNLTGKQKASWQHSEWIICEPAGTAEASLNQTFTGQLTGATVTATPATPANIRLRSVAATAWFGADFAADRDLAKQWRTDVVAWTKAWNRNRLEARKVKQ